MSLIDDLYPVKKSEFTLASKVIANAFSEKPMLKKLGIPQEDMENMFKMMTLLCARYGEIYGTSGNLEGVMMFLPDKYAIMKTWHVFRSGAIFPALKINKQLMGLLKEVGDIVDEDKKNLNIGPYIDLLAVGIAYEHQGKGFGGKLLRALFEKADREKKAVYLETDTQENVKLYEHYGFEVIKEIILPSLNIPMWEMVRPSSAGTSKA